MFQNLSYNILNDRLDVEECVNDAYLGTWNAIPPERPNPLLTFVCKIVRNISIKKYHAKTANKRNSAYDVAMSEVANYILAPNNVEAEMEAMGELSDKYITEARAAVWGWVSELYQENMYKIFFDGEAEETVGLKYELGWLPEGTELLINFLYSADPDSVYYLIAEDAIRQDVTVNGLPGEVFISPSEEETNIVWSDDSIPVMFSFTAEYDVETLIKVAENVKVVEIEE